MALISGRQDEETQLSNEEWPHERCNRWTAGKRACRQVWGTKTAAGQTGPKWLLKSCCSIKLYPDNIVKIWNPILRLFHHLSPLWNVLEIVPKWVKLGKAAVGKFLIFLLKRFISIPKHKNVIHPLFPDSYQTATLWTYATRNCRFLWKIETKKCFPIGYTLLFMDTAHSLPSNYQNRVRFLTSMEGPRQVSLILYGEFYAIHATVNSLMNLT